MVRVSGWSTWMGGGVTDRDGEDKAAINLSGGNQEFVWGCIKFEMLVKWERGGSSWMHPSGVQTSSLN